MHTSSHSRLRRVGTPAAVALAVLLVTLASAGVAGAATGVASQSFATCDEAAAAGFTDLAQGSPGYSPALDRDGDGVACETEDRAEPAPTPEPAPTTPPTTVPAEVLGAAQTAQTPPGELASTGTTSWILTAVALVLVLIGHRMIRAGYDRLDWITGRRHADVRFTVEPVRRRR